MLRPLVAILLAVLSFAVVSAPRASAADGGDSVAVKQVSQTFLKGYLASKDPAAYASKSPLLTPAAKNAYHAFAKKADKDGGPDHDPVTKGQDNAESYKFVVGEVHGDKATVSAEAKGFPTIHMQLVKDKSGWKIDGAGEINMGKGR